MPETPFSSQPRVEINDAKLHDDLAKALGPCWVESSVNLPGAFHLTFREPLRLLAELFPSPLIGAKVAVYAVTGEQGVETPLITGFVTGVEAEYQRGLAATVLRGLDHSFKMLRHRRATGYYNMTAAEIVTELAEADGVELGVIEQTSPQYELITQPNISDWQFVKYLADSSDMEADFDDEGLLRFRKARPAASAMGKVTGTAWNPRVLEFDSNMLLCRASITASDQVTEVTSRGWNVAGNRTLLGKAPAVASPGISIGTTPGEAVSAFGPVTLTETGTPYGTDAEADRAAASLAADVASAFAELEVQVQGQPDLVPGLVVELKEAGPPFDGTYTITATRHEFDNKNNYTTWVWVTGRQVRTLYGLASGGEQPAPRIPGVVNAIVDAIDDDRTENGRVKLRFPWFSETYKTDWVRTVQFGGHKGGGVISPEVGDEVLVAFDRGSMDHPYVLGGLYSNAENEPSAHDVGLHTGGRLNRRSLVSRSGQRLELLDAEGMAGVRLRSGNEKLTVFLEETQTKITISSDGAIDISGKEKITLDAPYVNISGEFVNIKGITTINGILTQNGDTEINGVTAINGATEISGGAVISGGVLLDGAATINGDTAIYGELTVDGVGVP